MGVVFLELILKNFIFNMKKTYFYFYSFLRMVLFLLLFFIFSFFVFYLVDLLFNVYSGKYQNPLFGFYIIVTPSMVPTINVNDIIVVKRINNDRYNIGDIISFSSSDINYNGLTITHRIVDKKKISYGNSVYTTKGDNNYLNDSSKVLTNSIYGKVLFKIPKMGYIRSVFSSPIHYFICLLIPAFLFVIYEIMRISIFLIKRIE